MFKVPRDNNEQKLFEKLFQEFTYTTMLIKDLKKTMRDIKLLVYV